MDRQDAQAPGLDKRRILGLGYGVGLLICALMLRLFFIYWFYGEHYRNMAELQQNMQVTLGLQQGDILDRWGRPFTQAGEVRELFVFPGMIRQEADTFKRIEALTGLPAEAFFALRQPGEPYIRAEIIGEAPDLEAAVHRGAYPGMVIHTQTLRYGETSLARHVVGHLRRSDNRPEQGIEKVFEALLHPKNSAVAVQLVTDARLKPIPGMRPILLAPDYQPGDVQLTLDYDIQGIVESVLDQAPDARRGVVVVEVKTGNILALASRPQYDQRDPLARLGEAEDFLLSIPTQAYPLGSVFKVVVAAAALEQGVSTSRIYTCTGGIYAGQHFFPCRPGGLGDITLRQALAHSCNDTFIRLAREIGGDVVIETARKMGLGAALPIELRNDPGRLMAPAEYAGPGYGNLAIGQGTTLVTPLQAAALMNVIASGGVYKPLRLVQGLHHPSEGWKAWPAGGTEQPVLSKETARYLAEALRDTTQYGTGQRAQNLDIGGTAGKTGTPQVSDPMAEIYGWFAGFYPWDDPKYTVIVLSKEGLGGGRSAAPLFEAIARRIWDWDR